MDMCLPPLYTCLANHVPSLNITNIICCMPKDHKLIKQISSA